MFCNVSSFIFNLRFSDVVQATFSKHFHTVSPLPEMEYVLFWLMGAPKIN